MSSRSPAAQARERRRPVGVLIPSLVVGIAMAVAAFAVEPTYGWSGLLIGAVFGVTIAIGGALFAAINVVAGARWWTPVRHHCIAVARTLPVPSAALGLVLAFGVWSLYPWADADLVANNHLVHGKTPWLNWPFFVGRSVAILLLWFVFVAALRKRVEATDPKPPVRTAIGFLIIFAITISVAMWDWAMSLEPEWFSTMHGVYGFAGCLQVGIAAVALRALRDPTIGDKPLYDLGSLMFAFSLFWGYIWYSQGMLIWYANIPEETAHYATRLTGDWSMLFWLNPVINAVLPIVLLMSRHAKRSRFMVGQVALIIIVGHLLDVLLLVGPAVGHASTVIPLAAAGSAMAIAAGMILLMRQSDGVSVRQ